MAGGSGKSGQPIFQGLISLIRKRKKMKERRKILLIFYFSAIFHTLIHI
jgi:hypothetical protein